MKKPILFLLTLFMSVVLIACSNLDEKFDQVFGETLIAYEVGDHKDQVTKDITLVTTSRKVDGAKITWTSDLPDVLRIEGKKGIVTRPQEDTTVTLTASVTLEGETKEQTFTLKVIKREGETPEGDQTAPVIQGTKNWTLTIGDTTPDFLEGVSATDGVDGEVIVTIINNTVNLSVAGVYEVTYQAVDKAGNPARKTVTVTVNDIDVPVGESHTEDFSGAEETGSSYSGFTFTGVNGITWTLVGARTDLELDGRAITFKTGSLKATIPGGISSFTVDVVRAFTNTSARKLELYINGNLIESYTVDATSDTKAQFHVETLNISDEFTFELRAIGSQITIDNLTWKAANSTPSEQLNLNKDKIALLIPTRYMEAQTITLPTTGTYGSTITWSFVDPTSTNNSFISLETKAVTMPTSGEVSVGLRATLMNGTYETTKDFTLILGEGEPLSIASVRGEANGTKLITKGVITTLYETENTIKFYIEDSQSGVLVIASKDYASQIKIGNEVSLIGTKTIAKGEVLIENLTKLTVLGTKKVTPTTITTPVELDSNLGKRVQINGLLKQVYGQFTEDYILVNEEGEFKIVIPEDLSQELRTQIQTLFANKEAGIQVSLKANVSRQTTTNVLLLVNPTDGTVGTFDATRAKTVIKNHFEAPSFPEEVTNNLTLTRSDELLFGATITWSSNNTSVIKSDGTVTQKEEDTTVRLSYIITFKGETIESGYFDLLVPEKLDFEGYYASLSGLSGQALKAELTRIIRKMNDRGYDMAKTALTESDADPDRPGYMLMVYNRDSNKASWDGSWDREHVWPQSKLENASKSDLHNLKPSRQSLNSSRGNLPYVEGTSMGRTNGGWFPGEEDKGDIARIVLYMNTRWGLSINQNTIGNLQTFIMWHNEDPVDAFERQRNEVLYSYQNNRNPYIDHPELVDEVYGSYTPNQVSNLFDPYNAHVNYMMNQPLIDRPLEDRKWVA